MCPRRSPVARRNQVIFLDSHREFCGAQRSTDTIVILVKNSDEEDVCIEYWGMLDMTLEDISLVSPEIRLNGAISRSIAQAVPG